MTIGDRWKKRPCVQKYWAFKDEVRAKKVIIYNGDWITFIVPMPKSWSKKKKEQMAGQYHEQKPDLDNFLKGLMDAVFDDDSKLADIRVTKMWGYRGQIVVDKKHQGS